MKFVVIAVIQLYWLIAPKWLRERCLFEKTCSKHVYKAACIDGWRAAFAAFLERYGQCRPGYHLLYPVTDGGLPLVQLADGTVIAATKLSAKVRANLGC